MPNFKELLRITFIYSWISPMFFNILFAIARFFLYTNSDLDQKTFYFYICAACFGLFLIFLFVVLLKVTKIAESKKLLNMLLFAIFFTLFSIIIYAALIPILNYFYNLDIISYVL